MAWVGNKGRGNPTSEAALRIAGLDWQVIHEPIYTDNGGIIPGYKANICDSDRKVFCFVSDRYKIIQN